MAGEVTETEASERRRLEALRSYAVLDSPPEDLFDRAAAVAAAACRVPIALVSLVDENRQWFKACIGLGVTETPRSMAFCAHAIWSDEPLVIPDALDDVRFRDNPLVQGPPHIRFYAGAPIVVEEGVRLGTVCVIDTEPRRGLEAMEAQVLTDLAAMVADGLNVRRRALAARGGREARAHLAAIVESSRDAVLSKTLDGTILSWNRAAERLYGYAATEVVGSSIARLMPPDRPEEMHAILRQVSVGQVIERLETVRVRKDGALVPVMLTISPIRDEGGRIVAASTIARDISEEKRLKAELHAARDQAEEASRLKSEFLATMSHEIRTPLNGVVGMIGLLIDSELDPQQRRYAETAGRSAGALMSVLNDILDFSKIEAGRLDLEEIAFDVRSVIEDVAEILAERAHEKHLELVAFATPEVPEVVLGDPGRLRQILLNLASNAIKFTDTGEVVIRASVAEATATDVCLRVAVLDTGVGIEPGRLAALFEPFTQADASTTRRYGGTGLGLAISARLAELMGGALQAESEPARGSTFSFTLRVGKGAPESLRATSPGDGLRGLQQSQLSDAIAAVRSPDAPPAGEMRAVPPRHTLAETQARGQPRILVAEDNPVNQQVAAAMLARLGYRVDIVSNGVEAVDAVGRGGYGAVLMDCQMPEMDGYTATARIRELEARGHRLPVIALTAGAMEGERQRCLEAGMDDYLTKPISSEALNRTLRRWIGEGDAVAQPSPANVEVGDLDRAQIEGLRQLSDGPDGRAGLERLVETYAESGVRGVDEIRRAVSAGNLDEAACLAHSLAGSSANLGARSIAELARRLESAAAEGITDSAIALADELAVALPPATAAIRALLSAGRD